MCFKHNEHRAMLQPVGLSLANHFSAQLLDRASICCSQHSALHKLVATALHSSVTLVLNCEHRAELFRSMIAREVAFFDQAEVGVLTSRLGSDCQAVVRCLSSNINVAARNSLQCIGAPASWPLDTATPPMLVPAC